MYNAFEIDTIAVVFCRCLVRKNIVSFLVAININKKAYGPLTNKIFTKGKSVRS